MGPATGSQFYFINKSSTSSTLSRSHPTEKAAIQRYVQTGRKRSRPSKSKAHFRNPQAPEAKLVESSQSETAATGLPLPRDRASGTSAWTASEPLPEKTNAGQLILPSDPLRLPTSEPDPFASCSVALDRTVHGLLHYYVHYYHPTLWPNEMIVLKHGFYTFHNAMQRILRTAVASPLVMYCLLSAAASRMQHVDRLPADSVTARESFYMTKATGLLARHLRDGHMTIDLYELRQNLICVMFLLSAESYRDNVSAASIHMQAAQSLVGSIGGLASLPDESLQNQLAMGDLFLACVKMEPCLFEPFYDPGPSTVLDLQASELGPASQGLCWMASALRVVGHPGLKRVLELVEELAESYSIKCRINTFATPARRVYGITRWVTTRNMAIRNRLLGLHLSSGPADALRVAVIMWSLLTMNVTGRTKTVKIMAPKLLLIIESISQEEWADLTDIRTWILTVAYQCAAKDTGCSRAFVEILRDEAEWLLPRDRRSYSEPEDEKRLAGRLEEFQSLYFFDQEVQRPRTLLLAQQLLEYDRNTLTTTGTGQEEM